MKLLLLYWGVLILAYIIASKLRSMADKFVFMQKAMMAAVYILVLIMGLRMGVNEQVTSNLGSIGLKSLVITIFTVGGSMLAIFGVRKILKIDRYGSPIKQELKNEIEQESKANAEAVAGDGVINCENAGEKSSACEENRGVDEEDKDADKLDFKSTLIILALVVIGMLIGCFVIAQHMQGVLPAFDRISNISLIIFLCLLLAFVGFDLGLSGNVAANIKSVGIKALAFPFAAVIGTLVLGVVSGLFFGFSVREGLAISAGFGWYTYAPAVIAGAGSQYAIASAVSFMHNAIRETAAIVLIPVFAKKFGYLEVTGMPGVAAMDVCMPIVERSCRPDTVVYSFATGLLMCVTTSVLVPLVMGL